MASGSVFREVVRFCDKIDSSAGWLRLVDESTDSYGKRAVCQISRRQEAYERHHYSEILTDWFFH